MREFQKLETALGYEFKNIEFLGQTLTHRSYINEHPDFKLGHNERLEFLGDAVLEIVVTEHLFNTFPDTPEGDLTDWRASLVNAKMLASIAQSLSFKDTLYFWRAEAKDANSKARQYILANAMEAIIGAMYLDGGLEAAKAFIHRSVINQLDNILTNRLYLDPKSRFQEKAQELAGITPHYRVISENGPDHEKIFEVGLYLDEELVAVGRGSSKQEAQVAAASEGLMAKGWK